LLQRIKDWLGLERDVMVMILTVLVITLSKQLWTRYVPKYLEYPGAPIWGDRTIRLYEENS